MLMENANMASQVLDVFSGSPMRVLLLVPSKPLLTGFSVMVRRLYTHNTGSGKPQTVISLTLTMPLEGGFAHIHVYQDLK